MSLRILVKNRIPVYGVMIFGIITGIAYYLPIYPFKESAAVLTAYGVITFDMLLLLGVLHVSAFEVRWIMHKKRDWWASFITLAVFLVWFIPAVYLGNKHPWYSWAQDYFHTIANKCVTCLLALWIIASCARTFRAKSLETTILLIVGFIVVLRNAPVGGLLGSGVATVADWLMGIPSSGAGTGVLIGATVGQAAQSLRVLVGIDRTYLGLYEE